VIPVAKDIDSFSSKTIVELLLVIVMFDRTSLTRRSEQQIAEIAVIYLSSNIENIIKK